MPTKKAAPKTEERSTFVYTMTTNAMDEKVHAATKSDTFNNMTKKEAIERFFEACHVSNTRIAFLISFKTKQVVATYAMQAVKEIF